MRTCRVSTPALRFALICAVLALGVIIPVIPGGAYAAGPGLSLSKYVVSPGDTLTVNGSGFKPGDTASVTISVPTGSGGAGTYSLGAAGARVNGNGSFSTSIRVPAQAQAGIYAVRAEDAHGNAALRTVQVPPTIQVKLGTPGPKAYLVAGQHFMVTATGFKSGDQVTVRADFPFYNNGKTLTEQKTKAADTKGVVGPLDMQVPWGAKDGAVTLTVAGKGGKSDTVTPSIVVVHNAFVYVVPNQTPASSPLTILGGGFVPGARVTLSVPIARTGNSRITLSKTVGAGGEGAFTTQLSLPGDVAAGSYTLTATGSVAQFHASSSFKVTQAQATPAPKKSPTAKPTAKVTATPKPTASPTAVPASIQVAPIAVIPGADVYVKGFGFSPGTSVSVSTEVKTTSGSAQRLKATATVNNKGEFTATLHTPGDAAAGKYQVSVIAQGNKSFTGTLTITPLKPAVVVVPTLAVPGTTITVNGFGFSSGAVLTVYIGNQKLGTVNASTAGAFKTTFTVPKNLATGTYTLTAAESGRKATIPLRIYRTISTHFYFASIYTGPGFHEYLLFVNTSEIQARVTITYQLTSGSPRSKQIVIPAHARVTEDVNNDLGGGVNAAAVIATDVPISAERMVLHGAEGSIDPGTSTPSRIWYFANGNTSHQYHEYIAVQNPTNAVEQVTLQVQPTHSRTYYLRRTMQPQSRTTFDLNKTSHDAIGVIVTANGPIVANRTIFIHNGLSSKTGVRAPQKQWFFASGPTAPNTRNWIGVINTTNQPSYLTLRAYGPEGAQLTVIKRWLKPYAREGYLMNKYAGQTDVAVVLTTSQPSISEQSTFVIGNHDAHTDSFGVSSPQKSTEFAEATTWAHQDNLLAIFNPNAVPVPVVVQFLNAHGQTEQQSYTVSPFAHAWVDVGKVTPNSQLGLLVACSDPVVVLDRQQINDGRGAMTTLGTQS